MKYDTSLANATVKGKKSQNSFTYCVRSNGEWNYSTFIFIYFFVYSLFTYLILFWAIFYVLCLCLIVLPLTMRIDSFLPWLGHIVMILTVSEKQLARSNEDLHKLIVLQHYLMFYKIEQKILYFKI